VPIPIVYEMPASSGVYKANAPGYSIVVPPHTLYGHRYTSRYRARIEHNQQAPKEKKSHDRSQSTSHNLQAPPKFPSSWNITILCLWVSPSATRYRIKQHTPGFSGSLSGGSRCKGLHRQLHHSYGMHVYGELWSPAYGPIQSSRLVDRTPTQCHTTPSALSRGRSEI
jgi:hypothetical protein